MVADGSATKIFLPTDLSATLGSLGAIAELFRGDGGATPVTVPSAPQEESAD